MAEKNARDALEKRNAKQQIQYERTLGACRQLGEALGIPGALGVADARQGPDAQRRRQKQR